MAPIQDRIKYRKLDRERDLRSCHSSFLRLVWPQLHFSRMTLLFLHLYSEFVCYFSLMNYSFSSCFSSSCPGTRHQGAILNWKNMYTLPCCIYESKRMRKRRNTLNKEIISRSISSINFSFFFLKAELEARISRFNGDIREIPFLAP